MKFNTDFLIKAIKKIPSEILAFQCCKAKSEKAIIQRLAFNIERIFSEDEKHHLYTWVEYSYGHFNSKNNQPFKYLRADLAIVDKESSDRCYLVIEAKLGYSFDCFNYELKNIKKGIVSDLDRLNRIKSNKNNGDVEKYFIQFLVHYRADKVHEYIHVYGREHNNQVKKNETEGEVYKRAEEILSNYFENEIITKYPIKHFEEEQLTLGTYHGVEVILLIFLLELK